METELWKRRIFGNLESIKSRQCNKSVWIIQYIVLVDSVSLMKLS